MTLLSASDWTPRKEAAFREALTIYALIAKRIQAKHSNAGRWFYFEPTAGSGYLVGTDGKTLEGSPLIALDVFARAELLVDCLFIEHDPGYYDTLSRAVAERDYGETVRWEVRCRDSRDVLSQKRRVARECGDYGLIYWDGLARDTYPAAQIAVWLRRYHLHDVLGMASGTAPKRMGRERLDAQLQTAIPSNGRTRYGYVTDTHDAWGWVFSFVTGHPPVAESLSSPAMRLHEFTSKRGQEVLHELATTKKERQLALDI